MYDPLVLRDLVSDELAQRQETGFDVADLARRLAGSELDHAGLTGLLDEMETAKRQPGWPYQEPDDLPQILAELPPSHDADAPPVQDLPDRIQGAWTGRVAGCNLGKPFELGWHWTSARIRQYLETAGAYPLRDYAPALDPMPDGFELHPSWPATTLGNVSGSARDDDIDYTILNLLVLEDQGPTVTTEAFGETWLRRLPALLTYTAERAAYRNLINGLAAPRTATTRNPYREWIGAAIRADVFGYVRPGRPRQAAELAYRDARLSHTGNGIYAEMWAAALIAAAFSAPSLDAAVHESLRHIPRRSRLAEAIESVVGAYGQQLTWEKALAEIQHRYGHYSWVHSVNNACIVTAALLWGGGDFTTSVALTVQAGWDTDSNGATVGSVMGAALGTQGIPQHFSQPLRDQVRPGIFGCDTDRISELARRTTALARAFADDDRAGSGA